MRPKKDKKDIYAPFGIATKRFATIGFHPNLDPSGSLQKKGGIGPGYYDPKFQDCWYKTHYLKETWTRKTETEEFSKMLGYRNAEVLKKRQEALKANGPGTLDISESLFKPKSHNVKENLIFGKAKRVMGNLKNLNPPPGSYGKNHDPYLRYEESGLPYHQWTPIQPFEWDNFINRFKIGRYEPRTLPPNLYPNKFQVGIEQTISKKVSKRGPYDCFTGPRDSSTIKGYFAPRKFQGPNSWPMTFPGEMEKLKEKQKRHYGKFLKCERFTRNPGIRLMLTDLTMCPKNPTDPGPGHYNIASCKILQQNKNAFNQSVHHVRPMKQWEIMPGVGRNFKIDSQNLKDSQVILSKSEHSANLKFDFLNRYNAIIPKCKHKEKRESFMFKSRSKREFYHIETFNNF